MNAHEAYIKAYTSYGGDDEPAYAHYHTEENEIAFDEWLREQPKVSGKTLYRGYRLDRSFFEEMDLSKGAILLPLSLSEGYYPAFTDGLLRASTYMNEFGSTLEDGEKIFCELHTSGKYMVDCSEYSLYPQEGEHHCSQDARFRVIDSFRKGAFTTIVMEEI